MSVQHYRQLIAWQKAMELVRTIYDLTAKFPKEETYSLTAQLRRAAISVPSNIAEGQGRDSTKEFLHHLSMAYGSLMEVETQGMIGQDLGYVSPEKSMQVLDSSAEVGRIINGLMKSLRDKV